MAAETQWTWEAGAINIRWSQAVLLTFIKGCDTWEMTFLDVLCCWVICLLIKSKKQWEENATPKVFLLVDEKEHFFFKCMQPRFLVRDKQGGAVSSYKQCNLEQICSFLWCLFTSEFYSYSWQGYLCKEKTFLVSLESIPPWRLIAKLIASSPMSQETEGITAPCVWVSRGQTNRTHGTSEGFPAPSLLSLCSPLPAAHACSYQGFHLCEMQPGPCSTHTLRFVEN